MFGEWTETDRMPFLFIKNEPREKRNQGRPLKRLRDC
jgi:hypothetical protein